VVLEKSKCEGACQTSAGTLIAGVDLPTVKRISGHKTLQMVERYSHQNGAHIQAAMDKLEERYHQIPSYLIPTPE
jgi:hypothetical protein